jgi:hypothetical protein
MALGIVDTRNFMRIHIDQQCHGYKNGHQLLAGSIKLSREDQDTVDRLSDISGPLRPSEVFEPYLTSYPLPGGSFYVIARTWQDLNAARAGCVLTRSLFIKAEAWESLEWIDPLFIFINPIDRMAIQAEAFEIEPQRGILPPIPATRGVELVEALFLEDRKPIAVFDEPEAEIITRRLLTALWPGLRRSFSVCSYALGPRQIGGRSFDLVFTSNQSRSRFARWEGRRVEGGSQKLRSSRHKWSLATARRIFEEPEPSLTGLDALGVLGSDATGDESNLRLALLWNDLVEQSATSPTAILGMLDVLQTQNTSRIGGKLDARLLALRGIELAKGSYQPQDMLHFVGVLLAKMAEEQLSLSVLKRVQKPLSEAAEKAPQDALNFLISTATVKYPGNSFVWASIGDGLAAAGPMTAGLDIGVLPEEAMLRLLADSRRFARRALSFMTNPASGDWSNAVLHALSFPDDTLLSRARRNLLPHLDKPEHATVLAECLRGADPSVIARAIEQLWKATGLSVAEFDAPFVRAARGFAGLDRIRSVILALPETDHTNRFLGSTLHPTSQDMKWLFGQKGLDGARLSRFLIVLLEAANDDELLAIAQDIDIVKSVAALLSSNTEKSIQDKLAYLLVSSDIDVEILLRSATRILLFVSGRRRSELVNAAVRRGLKEGTSKDDLLIRSLMKDDSLTLPPEHLIAHAISSGANRDRLSSNLIILNDAIAAVRRKVLMQVDGLCDRLVRGNAANLTTDAIEAWAALISDSGSINRAAQLRAASAVLSFSLAFTSRPVSPLIVVAFPIVYRELQEGREAPSFLSFFFFTDWDRCKTARKDLVRAFLRSNWPPVDLVSAVLPTGDLGRVFRILVAERGNEVFIPKLRSQLRRLPKNQQAEVASAIRGAADGDSKDDSEAFLG